MPRSLIIIVVLAAIIVAALFALSRIDPSRTPRHVEKIVPENALTH